MNPSATDYDPTRSPSYRRANNNNNNNHPTSPPGAGGGYYAQQQQQQQQQQPQQLAQQYQNSPYGNTSSYGSAYYHPDGTPPVSGGGGSSSMMYGVGAEAAASYGGGGGVDPSAAPWMPSSPLANYADNTVGGGGGGGGSPMLSSRMTVMMMAPPMQHPLLLQQQQQQQQPGSYYEIAPLHPAHGGGAVTAVAYDPAFDAVYAAGCCQSLSRHRHAHRAARTVAHNASDGALHSCVASHPEAPPAVLNALYAAVYCDCRHFSGNSTDSGNSLSVPWLSPALPRLPVPRHAYQPPYGRTDPAIGGALGTGTDPTRDHQLGVACLLPVQSQTLFSVSPAGARLHRAGGAALAEAHVEGLLAGTPHPNHRGSSNMNGSSSTITHMTVGGLAVGKLSISSSSSSSSNPSSSRPPPHHREQQIHCLDLFRDLRIVSSHALGGGDASAATAATCLATSHARNCVAAGCSDGTLRLVDARVASPELAQVRSHRGGVVGVAVSPDGHLMATTGYGSKTLPPASAPHGGGVAPKCSQVHGFPDPIVLINDIRYLGRGGFPHSFSGAQGGPRFLSFVPEAEGQPSNRLLVASGQMGGGCQIVVPFGEDHQVDPSSFIIPQLGRWESISSMCLSEDRLALGTSHGKVLQYKMTGFQPRAALSTDSGGLSPGGIFIPSNARAATTPSPKTKPAPRVVKKQPLVAPPFQPRPPPLSLEATLLLKDQSTASRLGVNPRMRSIFGTYVLAANPTVSAIGDVRDRSLTSFGPLASNPLLMQSRFKLSPTLLCKSTRIELDSVQTIPMSELENNIFDDHRPERIKSHDRRKREPLANPNKLIYADRLFKDVYDESFNRSKLYGRRSRRYDVKNASGDSDDEDESLINIPTRYRLMLRPANKSAGSFSHSDWNKTGIVPGFDYPLTMPNAFISPVLMLLYFIPEFREASLGSQLGRTIFPSSREQQSLISEMGFLFHRINCLARFAMLFPTEEGVSAMTRVEAWAPTSFLSRLVSMPEAERFQILDGSPAAVVSQRRPEAFYRFLMYQLDNELSRGSSGGLLDSLGGMNFVSVNEYISGSSPPSKSTTRHMTVDLSYDYFVGPDYKSDVKPCFGDLLQYNLCKATRLRAWSAGSKSYETIVQRKIVTSLPTVLALSAACAGRKEEEGLVLWKDSKGNNNYWLPEMIEVEIQQDGSVVVRELVHDEKTGRDSWKECKGTGPISSSVSAVVIESTKTSGVPLRRYRLDAVVSLIRDDLDRSCPEEIQAQEGPAGHHVLHVRVPKTFKKQVIQQQLDEVKSYLSAEQIESISDMTLVGRTAKREIFQRRCDYAQSRLDALDEKKAAESSWILVNGFIVSDTVVEDARAFHPKFKDPSLVIFRAVDDVAGVLDTSPNNKQKGKGKPKMSRGVKPIAVGDIKIPSDVIRTTSLTNGAKSPHAANQKSSALPVKGDLVAFDAEFVAVAEEESMLTLTGSKVVLRETRHALARISVIDGRAGSTGAVIFDDHVQPNEEVTDYLTRFSGIVEDDLNPKRSKHHLITSRAAYLKLRCLVEGGCIFVGHGLQQDFWTANLAIPATQIIDTVDLYHKKAQRFISLRFLANFVLKRDMQTDVHDSVEDALAAFELYQKAIELKKNGKWETMLDDLYAFGQKNDWKLGVDGEENSDG